MEYFYEIKDKNGFIHSIDNLTITYSIRHLGEPGIQACIVKCRELSEKYDLKSEYWERLNVNACSKYQMFKNHIHLCNGIYLSAGKYIDSYELSHNQKKYIVFPLLRLEINPNKHFGKPIFNELLKWLKDNSGDVHLDKYDYAIDLPMPTSDVQVFSSRKEKGLYRGTRYFGQRNKNGYCKIYDKQKEQGLETPLTRIEHTISCNKTTKKVSFEKIHYKANSNTETKVNSTYQCIVNMANALTSMNIPVDDYIDCLDKRAKKQVKEALNNSSYKELEFDQEILSELLRHVRLTFETQEIENPILEDENGFLTLSDDSEPLPFD